MKSGWPPVWIRVAIAAPLVLVVLAALGFVWFASHLPRQAPAPAAAAAAADGIVVLTGGRDRIDAGLTLLNDGRGAKLFISGANEGASSRTIQSLRERSAKYDCCIEVGFDAIDTAGNATETAAWVKRESVTSLLVVTASYHMPRGLVELRRAMPDVVLVPHPVFPESVRIETWWKSPGTARIIASEAAKYWFAVLRAQISPGPLAARPAPA